MDKLIAKQHLEAELEELQRLRNLSADARAPVMLDQQSVGRLSRMDAMQQQKMELATEERRRIRVTAIKAALQRIEKDEYGFCLVCDEQIQSGRLAFDPAVALCIHCQDH